MNTLHVCPLSDLETTLITSGANWMVSLMGPGKASQQPDQISGEFLGLEFHDIGEPRDNLIAPTMQHIDELLAFFRRWDGQAPLLIHCWMGISRSTAAAAIALAQRQPDGDMNQLAQRLRTASPMATPNPLMISLADERLQLKGRLITAISNIGRGAEASQGVPFSLQVAQ